MADYNNKENNINDSSAVLIEALQLGTEKIAGLLQEMQAGTMSVEGITEAITTAIGSSDAVEKSILYTAVRGAMCDEGIVSVLEGMRADFEVFNTALMSIIFCEVLNTTADIKSRISQAKDRSMQLFGDPTVKKPDPNAHKEEKKKHETVMQVITDSITKPNGGGILQAILELNESLADSGGGKGAVGGTVVEFDASSLGDSGNALAAFIDVLKDYRKYINEETIEQYGNFMFAYINVVLEVNKHQNDIDKFNNVTMQMATSMDYIHKALKSPIKLMFAADMGKMAIHRAAGFFKYMFDKAFTPALLQTLVVQTKELKNATAEFSESTNIIKDAFSKWAEKSLLYNIGCARKGVKKMTKFFTSATAKLIPAIEEFNKQMPDIKSTQRSVTSIASIYKALAIISLAAVPITLLYPVARISIVMAKGLIKGVAGLGDTIHKNKDSFDKGKQGVSAIYKMVLAALIAVGGILLLSTIFDISLKRISAGIVAFLAVSLSLAVGARVVGLIAGKQGRHGINNIYKLVLASLIVLAALTILQYFITPNLLIGILAFIGVMAGLVLGIWGVSIILQKTSPRRTLKNIRRICWAAIILLGTLLLVAVVSTAYSSLIIKGLLIEMGLFAAQILMLGALKLLIKAMGGYLSLVAPLRLVVLLCAAAVLTVVALILLTMITTAHFAEVVGGIIILGVIMVGLIGVMKLMARLLTRNVQIKLYGTFISLGLLILAALATLGLIKLASMMATLDTLFGVLLIGAIFVGLIVMMRQIQKATRRINMPRVAVFLGLMLGALLLTCLIVGIAATQVNPGWLYTVIIVGGTLLGLAYVLKYVNKAMSMRKLLELIQKIGIILGTLLLTCLILGIASNFVSINWLFTVLIVGATILGLAYVLKYVNKIMSMRKLLTLIEKVGIILGVLLLTGLILGYISDKVSMNWVFTVLIIGITLIGLAGTLWVVDKLMKKMHLMSLVKNIALILATIISTAYSLGLAQKYVAGLKWETLLQMGVTLVGMTAFMWAISKLGQPADFIKAAAILAIICGAIIEAATGIYVLAAASKMWNKHTWEAAGLMFLTILGFALLAVALGIPEVTAYVLPGSVILLLLCGAILAASTGLFMLVMASNMWTKHTWEAAGLMFLTIMGFALLAVGLGVPQIALFAALGCGIMVLLAGTIILVSLGFSILAEITKDWNEKMFESAGYMFLTLTGFGLLAAALGVPPICLFAAIGCGVLILLTGTIIVAAAGLSMLSNTALQWDKKTAQSAEYMFDIITKFGLLAVLLGTPPICLFAAIGAPVLLLLSGAIMAASVGIGVLSMTALLWDEKVAESADFMFDIITKFALMAVVLGTPPICLFAAVGVPILLLLSGAIMVASAGIMALATTAKMIDEEAVKGAERLGPLITNLFASLDNLPSVFTLGKLMLKIPMFMAVSAGLGVAICMIAMAVQDIANMKVATDWDADGKPTAYRQLTNDDFELAAQNITSIVTTIGGAIMDLYQKDQENGTHMFESNWFEDNPFTVVTKSCSKLGKMISNIAVGVASMANLNVATDWNEEGKPIEFRPINEDDFKLASTYITSIVTTIGGAIIDLYQKDAENGTHMFVDAWIGDNPFVVVTKSCSQIGEMIANIAKGVSDMANLSVADKWNDKGEPIHYIPMNEKHFELASKQVKDIVTTFAKSILELAADPKYYDFFHTSWYEDESDFSRVIKACADIGQIISNIADGVVKIAAGTYKTYDDKGKETGTFAITDTMYTQAARNINRILTIIIEGDEEAKVMGLTGLGIKYRGILTDEDSTVKVAVDAIKGVSEFIGNLADAIIKVAGGTYEYTDESGKKIQKQLNQTVIELATQNIARMMGGLVAAVKCIYEETDVNGVKLGPYLSKEDIGIVTKQSFWTGENYEDIDYESSPFAAALVAVKSVIDIIGNLADQVLKLAAGEFNGKQVDASRIDSTGTVVSGIIKPLIEGILGCKLTEEDQKIVTSTVDTAISIFKKFSELDLQKLFDTAPKVETKTVINSIMEQMKDIKDLQNGEEGKTLLSFYSQTSYDQFNSNITIFLKYIDRIKETFEHTSIISNLAFQYQTPRKMFDTMMSDIDYIRLQLNDRAQFTFNLSVLEQFNKVLEYTQKISSVNSNKDIKEVRGLIHDINKLDSKKVDQFRSIFDAIRSLAQQLGSIDRLATVLSKELNDALRELTNKLALAGAQIDKADEYQEKRKAGLSELINTISAILDRPIMVTPAPLDEDYSTPGSIGGGGSSHPLGGGSGGSTGGIDYGSDSYSNPGPDGENYVPPSRAQQTYRPSSSDQAAMLAQALQYLRKMYGMLNS